MKQQFRNVTMLARSPLYFPVAILPSYGQRLICIIVAGSVRGGKFCDKLYTVAYLAISPVACLIIAFLLFA
jgi:hypothetical protein